MKTIEEQIKVMQHYASGGEIEYYSRLADCWQIVTTPREFNWRDYDYRIKEQKKTVTIEKWLFRNKKGIYFTYEVGDVDSYLDGLFCKKVKMLDSYEVEI